MLFVELAQAWGCQAKAWYTKGQLHVNQFCPLFCSDLLVFCVFFFQLVLERGREERNIDLLFHSYMHLLYIPCLGIKPETLAYQDNALTN